MLMTEKSIHMIYMKLSLGSIFLFQFTSTFTTWEEGTMERVIVFPIPPVHSSRAHPRQTQYAPLSVSLSKFVLLLWDLSSRGFPSLVGSVSLLVSLSPVSQPNLVHFLTKNLSFFLRSFFPSMDERTNERIGKAKSRFQRRPSEVRAEWDSLSLSQSMDVYY